MAHTPVDTHYAAPVNTPILLMPYLAQRTRSIFTNTLPVYLSALSTPSLTPDTPSCTSAKLAVSLMPDLENTLGQYKKRNTFPLNIKMMMTPTLQLILIFPITQSMTWKSLFFYLRQPKKLPRKTLEEKVICELGTITSSGLNKQFSFQF